MSTKWPKKRKSNLGKSRPYKLFNSSRSEKISCIVPSCNTNARSDNLRRHYKLMVKCDGKGDPVDEYSRDFQNLDQKVKNHTIYFRQHGYSLNNLPVENPKPTVSSDVNPFSLSKKTAPELIDTNTDSDTGPEFAEDDEYHVTEELEENQPNETGGVPSVSEASSIKSDDIASSILKKIEERVSTLTSLDPNILAESIANKVIAAINSHHTSSSTRHRR